MKIKNYNKFQHFKDRRPPWIKLHRELLDQRDISLISDRSFRVLIGLWLLASEDETMEGCLPEITEIAFRLRMPESDIIKSFQELRHFVVDVDIKMISERYQVDVPETETETETETKRERETERPTSAKSRSTKLDANWQLPDDYAIWAKKERPDLNINQVADGFKDYWISEAKAKADWFATWRNWIRKQRADKQGKVYEAPWQKAARLRMAEFAPGVAAKDPNDLSVIDMEYFNKPQEIKNGTSNSSD
jgi:hypothetical protein